MKKLLILLSVIAILISCEKDQTEAEALFTIFDKEIHILSDENQITIGEYNETEHENSDSVYLWLFNSIPFTVDRKNYTLKFDIVILEDSSKVFYDSHDYSYSEPNDYFVKMESLKNKFIIFSDSSIVFSDTSKYVETDFMGQEIEANRKEGLVIQLFDNTDNLVFISELKNTLASNYFEVSDFWTEKGINGSEDKLFISIKFAFELTNIENANDKISIEKGKANFWILDNPY